MLAIAIRILEAMFVVGILGSAVVVILTSIEDFYTLFKKDSSPQATNSIQADSPLSPLSAGPEVARR
jgi:hypothetical protein